MSSGVVKNNFQNISKIDLPISALFTFDQKEGEKCKFKFMSELVAMLFKQKYSRDAFNNLSKLITLSLKESSEHFADIIFSGNNGYFFNEINDEFNFISAHKSSNDRNDYLLMLNRVRTVFNNCSDLTNEQKFDFCSIERYFMKLFLKKC